MIFTSFLKKSGTRNQYISAFAGKVEILNWNTCLSIILVNIITLSHGCAAGWVSPFLSYLQSEESHLQTGPLSAEDVSVSLSLTS